MCCFGISWAFFGHGLEDMTLSLMKFDERQERSWQSQLHEYIALVQRIFVHCSSPDFSAHSGWNEVKAQIHMLVTSGTDQCQDLNDKVCVELLMGSVFGIAALVGSPTGGEHSNLGAERSWVLIHLQHLFLNLYEIITVDVDLDNSYASTSGCGMPNCWKGFVCLMARKVFFFLILVNRGYVALTWPFWWRYDHQGRGPPLHFHPPKPTKEWVEHHAVSLRIVWE